MAKRAHLSQRTLSNWMSESAAVKSPLYDTAKALMDAFQLEFKAPELRTGEQPAPPYGMMDDEHNLLLRYRNLTGAQKEAISTLLEGLDNGKPAGTSIQISSGARRGHRQRKASGA